jgi:UDP-N-acetylglucosamine 4-epimerase
VTGAAGFIGSHLVEALLGLDQRVVGLDNFSAGHRRNLDQVEQRCLPPQWARFRFVQGDIGVLSDCREVCAGADVVLHHAALCSVPASIDDPLLAHASNATGFVNLLVAARDSGVQRLVYASSSAVYGDNPALPALEEALLAPLSPYASNKLLNEVYANVFARCYGLTTVGLRYFNVFGRRQDPAGAYAAVIPAWIAGMLRGEAVPINGDGETSRDFCHVDNVVQANLLAATTTNPQALNQVYNIASGERVSLNRLFATIRDELKSRFPEIAVAAPDYRAFRAGDVRHSQADIGKAQRLLGYAPTVDFAAGLADAIGGYVTAIGRGP